MNDSFEILRAECEACTRCELCKTRTNCVFGTGNEQEYPVTLTTSQYRAILEAVSQVASAAVDSIYMIDLLAHVYLGSEDYNISYNHGYVDVVNVVLGNEIPQMRVAVLQHMYDKLLEGGTVTVLVSHI